MRGAVVAVVVLLGLVAACSERVEPPAPAAPAAPAASRATSPPGIPTAGSALPLPPGGRWVGIHDVVVAVPRRWVTVADLCVDVERDSVRVLAGTESGCVARPDPGVSALTIAPASSKRLVMRRRDEHATMVGGVAVVHGGVDCRASRLGPCTLTFVVPDADAAFRVTYRGRRPDGFVERLLASVTRLPPGRTTVPAVGFGRDVAEAVAVLERAGLEGRSPDPDWPHYATGTEPAAGSVVAVGSTVRLTVGDG